MEYIMTKHKLTKKCELCGAVFEKRPKDSLKQWESRRFCSMKCNNSSPHRVTDIFIRLEKFQVKKEGCWEWSGNTDGKGYGTISHRNGAGFSPEKAHRVSYEKEYGSIPDGLFVLHKCDNPECTNPEHLFLGTQKDNMQDCSRKNRLNPKSFENLIAGAKGYNGAALDKNKVKK